MATCPSSLWSACSEPLQNDDDERSVGGLLRGECGRRNRFPVRRNVIDLLVGAQSMEALIWRSSKTPARKPEQLLCADTSCQCPVRTFLMLSLSHSRILLACRPIYVANCY